MATPVVSDPSLQGSAFFDRVFYKATALLIVIRCDGTIERVNPAVTQLSGYPREEIVGRKIWEGPWFRDLPDEPPRLKKNVSQAASGEVVRCALVAYRTCSGEVRYVHRTLVPLPDTAGNVEFIFVEAHDVTEGFRAEQSLRQAEAQLHTIVDNASGFLCLVDLQGKVVRANRAVYAATGATEGEVVGKLIWETPWWHDLAVEARAARADLETALAGRSTRREVRYAAADGTIRFSDRFVSPVLDDHGKVLEVIFEGRDVTGIKTLEQRLREGQKLEALGRMAAGVAHEINNPLTYLLWNLESVSEDLEAVARSGRGDPGYPDMAERLREALVGAQRVAAIVSDLRSVTRPGAEENQLVDVNQTVARALQMIENQIRFRARLEVETEPVPPVRLGERRLLQVLLNLLINAVEAIEEGAASRNEIHVRTREEDGVVQIEIEDTGCGIPMRTVERLFDPFFTTKGKAGGTGLGLWICHGFVTAAGGRIDVETDRARGSRFTVRLPAAATEPASTGTIEAEPYPAAGRILVVEDEPYLREVTAHMLQERYDVVTAANAADALGRLAVDHGFDIILCDLMMDEMDGIEFRRAIESIDPSLARRVAFMTGGAWDRRSEQFLADPGHPWIEKPFRKQQLLRFVAGLVSRMRTRGSAVSLT